MSKQCPLTGDPCDECGDETETCGAQAFAKPTNIQVILVEKPPSGPEAYLGDGLYVSFDGYSIKLRAPRDREDHECYLEPYAFKCLIEFVKKLPGWEALLK